MSHRPDGDPRFRAAQLAALLARHAPTATPYHIAGLVYDLQRAGRLAVAWEVRRCNEPMTEAQEERGQARMRKAQDRLNRELAEVTPAAAPCAVSLGGDPRGPCASLHVPGERGDGWGDGFAVY